MEYIVIGHIINTHGIKGEIKINPLTDNVGRFKKLKKLYLGEEKLEANYLSSRVHKGHIILKLKEYNDINEVLKFKDQYLYIDREDLVKLPKDSFFIFELVGLDVFHINGDYIGKLSDVNQGAINDIYIVKNLENKEFMIPAVKEFVKEVDLDKNKMIIDPIEGMIE